MGLINQMWVLSRLRRRFDEENRWSAKYDSREHVLLLRSFESQIRKQKSNLPEPGNLLQQISGDVPAKFAVVCIRRRRVDSRTAQSSRLRCAQAFEPGLVSGLCADGSRRSCRDRYSACYSWLFDRAASYFQSVLPVGKDVWYGWHTAITWELRPLGRRPSLVCMVYSICRNTTVKGSCIVLTRISRPRQSGRRESARCERF